MSWTCRRKRPAFISTSRSLTAMSRSSLLMRRPAIQPAGLPAPNREADYRECAHEPRARSASTVGELLGGDAQVAHQRLDLVLPRPRAQHAGRLHRRGAPSPARGDPALLRGSRPARGAGFRAPHRPGIRHRRPPCPQCLRRTPPVGHTSCSSLTSHGPHAATWTRLGVKPTPPMRMRGHAPGGRAGRS
jgi:hypothetical protein